MLPGYHDIAASAVPFSSASFKPAADQFGSLPSLHVTWALWVAAASRGLVRRLVLRARLVTDDGELPGRVSTADCTGWHLRVA